MNILTTITREQILNHLWKIQKWFTETRLIEFLYEEFFSSSSPQIRDENSSSQPSLKFSSRSSDDAERDWGINIHLKSLSLSLPFDNCNNNKIPFKLNLSIPTFINLNTLCYCCRWMYEIKFSHRTNVSGCEHQKYEFYANFFPINEREKLRQDEVYVTVFWLIFNMILIFIVMTL